MSDAELIAASLADPERFGEIFERHFAPIHRYVARRLGDTRADDVAAQVFTVAFERRRHFDGSMSDARPWLYGIASNLVRTNRRSERRLLDALGRLASQTDSTTVDDVAAPPSAVEQATLARSLRKLNRHQRDVLLLHCWAGLTHAEIAVALGIPPGTVASRLSRARAEVRNALDEIAPQRTAAPTSKEER